MTKVETKLLADYNLIFVTPNETNATRIAPNRDLVGAIQAEVMDLGYIMTTKLMDAIETLSREEITNLHASLIPALEKMLGVKKHLPLWRDFPNGIPANTTLLWFERLQAYFEQSYNLVLNPEKCHILSCGHVINEDKFDGSNYTACPICERAVDLDNKFFKAEKERPKLTEATSLKVLDLGIDINATVEKIFKQLIGRKTVMSPADTDFFKFIVEEYGKDKITEWVETAVIPVKETVAQVCATLDTYNTVHLKTATDVLRAIIAKQGGDVSLVAKTKFKSMPKAERRAILSKLNSFKVDNLTEDILRNPGVWKRLGEKLHPFEFKGKFPFVAVAFAALRETKLDKQFTSFVSNISGGTFEVVTVPTKKSKLKTLKRDIDVSTRVKPIKPVKTELPAEEVESTKLKFRNWTSQFNKAVEGKNWDEAILMLAARPGEFSRKLDFLLREVPSDYQDKLYGAFSTSVGKMSTPILCTLMSYLDYRIKDNSVDRIFMPKGAISKAQSVVENRSKLAVGVEAYIETIVKELLSRTEKLSKHESAVLDNELRQLTSPFIERNAARALVALPKGSKVQLDKVPTLRSFIFWMENSGQRVDLDSTFMFFGDKWDLKGECSYIHRTWKNAAKHSGDLTSAPAPRGASEFVDIDVKEMKKEGVKYVVCQVYSFNSIPFDQMAEAFAGVMLREDATKGKIFEPRTVQHRYDLQGDAQVAIPYVIDIDAFELMWLDINLDSSTRSRYQASWSHGKTVQKLCQSLVNYYSAGVRPSLFQVSALHVAARCNRVYIRKNGEVKEIFKGKGDAYSFYKNIIAEQGVEIALSEEDSKPSLAFLFRDDVELEKESELYTLFKENADGTFNYVKASDLISF